jgi:hypothetical protein
MLNLKRASVTKLAVGVILVSFFMSCAPKYGCPSNGKNAGAERYLNGDKVPKAKKFKA